MKSRVRTEQGGPVLFASTGPFCFSAASNSSFLILPEASIHTGAPPDQIVVDYPADGLVAINHQAVEMAGLEIGILDLVAHV